MEAVSHVDLANAVEVELVKEPKRKPERWVQLEFDFNN